MKRSSKVFIASDLSNNLYGFSVDTDGIDMADFINNPVLLYNHDYDKLLGLCEDVAKIGSQLQYVPSFDEEDKYAMKQYSKAEQGILRGTSIGLIPIEFDEVNKVMKRCSLKEMSLTPVPANRNAITLYDNNGQRLNASQAKEFMLSLSPKNDETQKFNMKPSLITALVALCVQAGHMVTLSDKSTEDEFEAGLKTVGAKITSLNQANTELSGKVKTLEDANKAAIAEEHAGLLKKAVDEKYLSAEQADGLKGLDLPTLKIALSAMKPATVKTIETGKGGETKEDQGGEKANWGYDEYALNAPQELERMQVTDNARFEKLLSAKVAKAREQYAIEV